MHQGGALQAPHPLTGDPALGCYILLVGAGLYLVNLEVGVGWVAIGAGFSLITLGLPESLGCVFLLCTVTW